MNTFDLKIAPTLSIVCLRLPAFMKYISALGGSEGDLHSHLHLLPASLHRPRLKVPMGQQDHPS